MKPRTLLLLLMLSAAGHGCGSQRPAEAPPVPVTVAEVGAATGPDETRYGGAIEPDLSVDVAFRVSGVVDGITQVRGADGRGRSLQDGDPIRRGAVLARLRQHEFRDQWSDAEAGFRQAQADYERAAQLYENRSVSKAEYDAAYARYTAGQARRSQAGISLGDATLRAPIDGVILRRAVEVGALAGPTVPAFTIADTRVVKVVFGVPDVAVAKLRLGDPLTIDAEAMPGRTLVGKITRISPSADRNSRVFEVAASLANRDGQLKVGMLATLRLGSTPSDSGVSVPLGAVIRPLGDTAGYAVLVVGDSSGQGLVAHRRRVTLGAVSGNQIAVIRGLQRGERVIVRGATIVADGQAVRLVP